jgi:tetratricopeptide (TPR) repeat protein
MFLKADRLEKERRLPEALAAFRACLALDPLHVEALARSSLILSWMGRTSEAVSTAWRALQLSKYDAGANYAFGVASRQAGAVVDALEAFGWAARSPAFATIAYVQMAELCVMRGSTDDAIAYARRAQSGDHENLSAHHILAAALRLRGDRKEAAAVLQQALEIDPLDHHASYELALLEGMAPTLAKVAKAITNEFPEQSVIETALWYEAIGRTNDALIVLRSGHVGTMSRFWQAYLQRSSDPAASRRLLTEALEAPIEFVVPFREEEIPLFRWTTQTRTEAWKAKYYLSLVLWSKGRTTEAFDAIRELKPSPAPAFYLTRASLRRGVSPKGEGADLAEALAQGPSTWRTWHAMNAFLAAPIREIPADSALRAAQAAFERFPAHTVIRMDLATALYAAGRFKDCSALLDSTVVLPYEGSWEAHDLRRRALLMLAVEHFERSEWKQSIDAARRSTEYPEHLGSGEPWEPDRRSAAYIEAVCHLRNGDSTSAASLLRSIAEYTARHQRQWGSDHVVGWAASRRADPRISEGLPSWIPPMLTGWLGLGVPLTPEQLRSLSPAWRVQYAILSKVRS